MFIVILISRVEVSLTVSYVFASYSSSFNIFSFSVDAVINTRTNSSFHSQQSAFGASLTNSALNYPSDRFFLDASNNVRIQLSTLRKRRQRARSIGPLRKLGRYRYPFCVVKSVSGPLVPGIGTYNCLHLSLRYLMGLI